MKNFPASRKMRAVHPTALSPLDIEQRIHTLRGSRVMLDSDLADLYKVPTKALNQAVKRNSGRFPEDFMFQLAEEESRRLQSQLISEKVLKNKAQALRSQIVTSKPENRGGRQYLPYAFTEQGVAMLSSVLKSERAIHVNISIMRTFVRLRRIVQENNELARKLRMLEEKYDMQLRVVFEALDAILNISTRPTRKKPFGFSADR